eukprot:10963356-Alexandrium_andersonii.AAC.1
MQGGDVGAHLQLRALVLRRSPGWDLARERPFRRSLACQVLEGSEARAAHAMRGSGGLGPDPGGLDI